MSLIIAILCALLGYAMLNIGLVLEKKGADSLPLIEKTTMMQNIKNFLGNKVWLVGFILTNIHAVFIFIALAMAPISVIAPLLGFGLCVLTIFSHFYLHEKIKYVELIGIAIIGTGIILIGAAAPEGYVLTHAEMITKFLAPVSLIFLLIPIITAAILCIYSISKDYKLAAIVFGIAAGVGGGIGGTFTKAITAGVDMANLATLFEVIGNFSWWIMLISLLAGNVLSMVLLQIGFQKGKAVVVGPIYSVLAMILPVFAGLIILGEWNTLIPLFIVLQIVGLIAITIGIIILSFYGELKKKKNAKEQSNEIE